MYVLPVHTRAPGTSCEKYIPVPVSMSSPCHIGNPFLTTVLNTQVLIMCVSFFHMITVIVFFQHARNFAPLPGTCTRQTTLHATCTTLHECVSHMNVVLNYTATFASNQLLTSSGR